MTATTSLRLSAGFALLALIACGEQPTVPLSESYTVTETASLWNERAQRLEPVQLGERAGVMASIATTSTPPVLIPFRSKALWTHGGRGIARFVGKDGTKGAVVFLYRNSGGPPAAIQTYQGTTLVSTNAYKYQRTTAGWLQTESILRIVRNNRIVGEVQTTVTPCRRNCAPQTLLDRTASLRGTATRALYRSLLFAANPASAQWNNMYWAACADEWWKYSATVSAFMSASAGIAAAEPLGAAAATPGLVILEHAMERAEQALENCMVRQADPGDNNELFPAYDGTGPSGGWGDPAGGGAGGGGGGEHFDCLAGSYAAACQKPFTL